MARLRSIKPEFWSSEQVMAVSRDARLLFIGIWNFADDEGRFKWKPGSLKAQVFPADDDVSTPGVERLLSELAHGGLLERYVNAQGEHFGRVTGWHHQRISHPTPSKLPNPLNCQRLVCRTPHDNSWSAPGDITEPSASPPPRSELIGIELRELRERTETPVKLVAPPASGLRERPLSPPEGTNVPILERAPEDRPFGAAEMRETFTQVFRAVHREVPKLDGKGTAELHERVLAAARDRGVDPRQLFEARLQRWLSAPLKPIERVAPYACFAASWPTLEEAPKTRQQRIDELSRKSAEALGRRDDEAYERLNREIAELMGVDYAAG